MRADISTFRHVKAASVRFTAPKREAAFLSPPPSLSMQDVHYSPCSLRLVLMGFAFQQGGVKPERDRQGELLLPRRTACGNGT